MAAQPPQLRSGPVRSVTGQRAAPGGDAHLHRRGGAAARRHQSAGRRRPRLRRQPTAAPQRLGRSAFSQSRRGRWPLAAAAPGDASGGGGDAGAARWRAAPGGCSRCAAPGPGACAGAAGGAWAAAHGSAGGAAAAGGGVVRGEQCPVVGSAAGDGVPEAALSCGAARGRRCSGDAARTRRCSL